MFKALYCPLEELLRTTQRPNLMRNNITIHSSYVVWSLSELITENFCSINCRNRIRQPPSSYSRWNHNFDFSSSSFTRHHLPTSLPSSSLFLARQQGKAFTVNTTTPFSLLLISTLTEIHMYNFISGLQTVHEIETFAGYAIHVSRATRQTIHRGIQAQHGILILNNLPCLSLVRGKTKRKKNGYQASPRRTFFKGHELDTM